VFVVNTLEKSATTFREVVSNIRIFDLCVGGNFTILVTEGCLELTDVDDRQRLRLNVSGDEVGGMVAAAISKALLQQDGLLINHENWLKVCAAVSTAGTIELSLEVRRGCLVGVAFEDAIS
jgi:hypothetical protein